MKDNKNIKILVIDDEQGIRDFLTYELASEGYVIVTANNGEEGVEKIKNEKFNLVISDIKMPKMDGMQALEMIKKIDPGIEVIMATGFGTVETAVASMKKGAYDFIQKPFNLEEIKSLIEKALEKAELKSLVALYETSRAIFASVKLSDLLPVLVKLSAQLLKADDVSIMLMGEDKKLYIAASQGLDDQIKKGVRLSLGDRVAGKVAEWQEPLIIVGSLAQDQRFADIESREAIRSSVIAPLVAKSGILGVLCAARTTNEIPFNGFDLHNAQIFLSQITQAIENARLYRELEDKMEALESAYAEMSRMKEDLVQAEKLAAIGELASGVAHELNNPLTSIIGLTDLLLMNDNKEEDIQDFTTIKEQAHRCRKIILNLLQFARKQNFNMEYAQVKGVLEKTLELLHYELKTSGIELALELGTSLPLTKIDSSRIQQVFLNIISNAKDSLAHSPRPKLTIKTENVDGKIKVYFIDNGCGMPADVVNKIFDPFFTTKEVGKGTGLGLSVSYGIVHDHGGAITVQSKEGEGAAFCVELPVMF